MALRTDWMGWGGAVAGAAGTTYLDTKVKRINASFANGELAKLGILAAQIFGLGSRGRYSTAIDGAAEWAVGSLFGDVVARSLGFTTAPTPVTTTVAGGGAGGGASAAAQNPTIPASGTSAAFDNPSSLY